MTKAKAATVAAALVNADNYARVTIENGEHVVYAQAPNGMVDVDVVKAFADAQSVEAFVTEVRFN
jgi:hypothetical protein